MRSSQTLWFMMTFRHRRQTGRRNAHRALAALLAVLAAGPAFAGGTAVTLSLETTRDSLDVADYQGALQLELPSGVTLDLAGGITDYSGSDLRYADTGNLALGFTTPRERPFALGLSWETWGAKEIYTTDTLTLDLMASTPRWELRASPAWLDIELTGRALLPGRPPPRVRTGAVALELAATWYGWDRWALAMAAARWDYDADVTRLSGRRAQLFLSNQALGYGYGLADRQLHASLDRETAFGLAGVAWTRTRSAVDGSRWDTLSLRLDWDVSESVTFYGEAGRVDAGGGGEDAAFATLGVSLRG